MGIAIPQVITPSKATGAQVIDGSLKFDKGKTQYLSKTFSSTGNRNVWTWSSWAKRGTVDAQLAIFSAHTATNNAGYGLIYLNQNSSDATFNFNNWDGGSSSAETSAVLRDTNGWYHLVVRHDESASPKAKLYINGQLQSLSSNLSTSTGINRNIAHRIGHEVYNDRKPFDGAMSQCYFIDGQSLGPENFGFTDPLTNTWKPKKYTGAFTQLSVNDGTTWSSSISGPVDSTYPLSNAFGGTIGSSYTSGTRPTVGNTLTFDISSKNLTVAKVRLNTFLSVAGNGATLQVNDTDVTTNLANGDQTHEITINGQFNNVKWSYDSGNGPYVYMKGIEVDLGTGRGYELLTDGLTDTGANSFYLPMDGNSPIGKDQSGKGNDWTPVNFGGSLELDNPNVSGVRPILNTTQGGAQAGVGVFGSKQNVGYAVTVYNDGGGNKYYIDGVKQDTITGLIRGATYTFDTSDSTVSSHPFRFSATSNGSHGGGSEYTNGVAAITGAATTITVPHNAPNTLYYYCTSHSGMGADITGITTNEKLADQYAWKCTLALPLVGGVGDVSPSIACTASSKTGSSDNLTFVGPGDMFYVKNSTFTGDGSSNSRVTFSSGSLPFGTGDFTIEFWGHFTATGDQGNRNARILTAQSESGTYVQFVSSTTTGKFQVKYNSGEPANISIDNSLVANRTRHYVYQRTGTTGQLIVDGVLYDTGTDNSNYADVGYQIGRYDASNGGASLHMADFRVYSGIQKYSTTGKSVGDKIFNPPSPSPDILPDTPSGVSGSSKLDKITDGAVAFDGTNDSLSIADHADFTFGSGDFTMEAFVYNKSSSYRSIVQKYGGNPSSSSWFWSMYNGQNQFYYYSGGNEPAVTSGQTHYNKWVHCAVSREGNTIRLFDNGELTGTLDVSSYDTMNDSTVPVDIGADYADNYDMDGFISNVRIVKGTALYTKKFTPPSAPLTNVTNTKLLCCQSPTSATEAAVSPSTPSVVNDAAATTFNPFNTDINTVRGQETGYCTLNPLHQKNATITENNLQAQVDSSGTNYVVGTIPVTSGRWYWEFTTVGSNNMMLGAAQVDASSYDISTGQVFYYYANGGNKYPGNSSYGSTLSVGDTLGVALDMDAGTLTYYKNGVSLGVAFNSGLSGKTIVPSIGTGGGSGSITRCNFGQKPFKFPPPDGFQPINAANVRPETVISRPDQYVGIVTYTGNNSARSITGYNFSPDLVFTKQRTNNGFPAWFDVLRGPTNALRSHSSQGTYTDSGLLTSFDSNGFSIGTAGDINSSNNYVGWCWKAGGSKNTFNVDDVGYATAAAAGLTGGDITPTGASVGTKQGFSIIKFTGSASGTPSISHGLSEAPNFIIQKDTGATTSWRLFMYNGTTWSIMNLDDASGAQGATETAPTSSLFYVNGNGNAANTQIAYLWHDVPGLQKFGTFEGNGNSDGPFIELGFRPSIILMRNLDNYGTNYDWCMYDNERAKFNPNDKFLAINLSVAENVRGDDSTDNSRDVDFLSNGFKIRNTASTLNLNSHTIFYAAWAEAPTVDLFGGGANAR